MPELRFSLDLIEVPIPCTVPWESMWGDDHVRHCDQCNRKVYRLSEMSREEAEHLIQKYEDGVCAQFFRRPDGTIVTRDCVALRWWRAVWSAIAFVVVTLLSVFLIYRVGRDKPEQTFSKIGSGSICSSKCWEPVETPPREVPEAKPE